MSVEFETIRVGERIPGVYAEIETQLAARGLASGSGKLLLIGQKTSAGTATALTPVQVTDASEAQTLFGVGSMCAIMVAAALAASTAMAELWVVPLADHASGVAATGTIEVAVSSPSSGTLSLLIGGELVEVGVEEGATADEVAAGIHAAIGDMPTLPTTSGVSTDTVTLTARNKGTLGNGIDISGTFSGTGVTLTITAMASGATDPTFQSALDAVYAGGHDVLVTPYATSTPLDALVDHLDSVSDGQEMRGAVGVAAVDDTVSNVTTLTEGRNAGRLTVLACEGTATWTPRVAAAYGALIAGESDPARPLNGLELVGVRAPSMANRYSRAELTVLLANGAAPIDVSQTGDVRVVRSISTYVADGNGAPDATLLDLQTMRSLDYVRTTVRTHLALRFARKKLADISHTENTADTAQIRAEILDRLKALEAVDIVQRVDDLKSSLVVERDGADASRVNAVIPSDIVRGLHVIASQIRLT